MSQVYNLEPPTEGKVSAAAEPCCYLSGSCRHCRRCLPTPCPTACCAAQVVLRTTLGDLDIELWSKEAPKACRNFVQVGKLHASGCTPRRCRRWPRATCTLPCSSC